MAHIFISYSRKDKQFVHQLSDALMRQNRDSWIDWKDLPPSADWLSEIYRGIENAHVFVFVISPDSIVSELNLRELEYAIKLNKRIAPIIRREVDVRNVPRALAEQNWIFFRDSDDFEISFRSLLAAIDTNPDWVRTHTRLLVRAIDWENKRRDSSLLLRGRDLKEAEEWFALASVGKEPKPTFLQSEYILASRQSGVRQQRILLGTISFGLIFVLFLSLFALFQTNVAITQSNLRATAEARLTEISAQITPQAGIEPSRQSGGDQSLLVVVGLVLVLFFGLGVVIVTVRRSQKTKYLAMESKVTMESQPKNASPMIFISYAKEDRAQARDLYSKLKGLKIKPWLDEEDILVGEEWEIAIPRAVRKSDFLVALLSNKSISKKGYVQKEMRMALDIAQEMPEDAIFLLPVRLEVCQVPDRLAKHQYVDLFQPNGFDKLVLSILTAWGRRQEVGRQLSQ